MGTCEKIIKKSSVHWCYAFDAAAGAASLCAFVSCCPDLFVTICFFFFFNNVQLLVDIYNT